MRALDLFCGGGGAALGMIAAGFEVVGVDTDPRCGKVYPGHFIVGDALRPPVRIEDFDLVWASPPCPAYSRNTPKALRDKHPDLIGPVRSMLKGRAREWVMENVPGSPLRNPVRLTGPMVGLERISRERWFELSWMALFPTIRRTTGKRTVTVTKSGGGQIRHRGIPPVIGIRETRRVMGIDPDSAMTTWQVGNAVPPPMAEMIARTLPRRNVGF